MKFPTPLIPGTLIRRYRRSLVDVRLQNGGVVTAHCPAFGPMTGCLAPGQPVLLSDSKNANRLHPLTWEMINIQDVWIGINPAVAKKVILEAVESGVMTSLREFVVDRGVSRSNSKAMDIFLQGMEQNCYIAVQSVSWAENGVALFPDSPNEKARRSLQELADIARQGHRAITFFFVQRGDCERFKPAELVDRDYLKAMLTAQAAGVEFQAYRGAVTTEEISLGEPIPYSLE